MEIDVFRYSDGGQSTLGLFFIDGRFECYTLEDQFREVKVYADTRIAAGRYEITFRNEGRMHEIFKNHKDARIKAMHKGMLWVRNVPNFEYILIHTGVNEKHTAGCLLVGDRANDNQVAAGELQSSIEAYVQMYPKVADRLVAGEKVFINYHDADRNFHKFIPLNE